MGFLQDILHPVLYPFKDILCQYKSIRGPFFSIDHEGILNYSIRGEKRISWFDPVAFKMANRFKQIPAVGNILFFDNQGKFSRNNVRCEKPVLNNQK